MFIFESQGVDGMSGSFMFTQLVHLLVMSRIFRVFMNDWDIRC